MPYEIYPTPNSQLMDDEFHDWLEKCPNNWVRLAIEEDTNSCLSATYKFYRNDLRREDEDDD